MVYQIDKKTAEKLAEMEEKRFGNKLILDVGVPRSVIFQKIATEIRKTANGEGEYIVIYMIDAITGKPKEMVTTSINLMSKIMNDLQIDVGDLFSIEKTNRRGADFYKVVLIARDEKNLTFEKGTPPPKLSKEASNHIEKFGKAPPPDNQEEAITID